jgi:hypothetical protein
MLDVAGLRSNPPDVQAAKAALWSAREASPEVAPGPATAVVSAPDRMLRRPRQLFPIEGAHGHERQDASPGLCCH